MKFMIGFHFLFLHFLYFFLFEIKFRNFLVFFFKLFYLSSNCIWKILIIVVVTLYKPKKKKKVKYLSHPLDIYSRLKVNVVNRLMSLQMYM